MAAIMIISMNISDANWMERYFVEVPPLLAEYGAETLAGSRRIQRIEGEAPIPDRMAVMSFPSIDAIERFMADERYRPFKAARHAGSDTEIFIFENAVKAKELV